SGAEDRLHRFAQPLLAGLLHACDEVFRPQLLAAPLIGDPGANSLLERLAVLAPPALDDLLEQGLGNTTHDLPAWEGQPIQPESLDIQAAPRFWGTRQTCLAPVRPAHQRRTVFRKEKTSGSPDCLASQPSLRLPPCAGADRCLGMNREQDGSPERRIEIFQ